MAQKSRYEGTKLWAKKHQDAIFAIAVGTFVVGLVIVSIKVDLAYQERLTAELNANIDALNALYHAKELLDV